MYDLFIFLNFFFMKLIYVQPDIFGLEKTNPILSVGFTKCENMLFLLYAYMMKTEECKRI